MKLTNAKINRYENSVMWQSRFSRFVVRCSHAFRDAVGLDITQVRIVLLAAHAPASPVGYFCETLSLRASTVSMALRALESAGYVERVTSDVDARSVCVRLTEEGYDVIPLLISAFDEIEESMDEYLQDGAFESITGLVHEEGFRAFLTQAVNFSFVDNEGAYANLRIDMADDPNLRIIDTGLYVEAIANLMCLLGRSWTEEGLNLRTGRILGLALLGHEKGESEVGVSTLRELLFMKPAEVSAGVMRLEQDGLVTRIRNEEDRRMTMVSLTKRGRNVALAALKHNLEVFEATCSGLVDVDPATCYKQ